MSNKDIEGEDKELEGQGKKWLLLFFVEISFCLCFLYEICYALF